MGESVSETKSWWTTLPVILTALAALITAFTGLYAARLKQDLTTLKTQTDMRIYVAEEKIDLAKYPVANCISNAIKSVIRRGGQVIEQPGDTWVNFKLQDKAISVFCKVEDNSLVVVSSQNQGENGDLASRLKTEILTGH